MADNEHMKEVVASMIDRDTLIRWTLEAKDKEIADLKQLLQRYYALLDTWDIEIAEHLPFSIAQAAQEEKEDLQQHAKRLLGK